MFVVFFFKQKTAYDMRISDWSSDVCSSDLVEVDLILGLALLVVEARETDLQRGLAERPFVRQFGVDAVTFLIDLVHIAVVADQIAGGQRAGDRGDRTSVE